MKIISNNTKLFYLLIIGIFFTLNSCDGDNSGKTNYTLIEEWVSNNSMWTQQFGTPKSDEATSIAIDSLGNIYFTGYTMGEFEGFTNANTGTEDIFIIKYNSNEQKEWIRQIGSSGSSTRVDKSLCIATDSLNNVFIGGSFAYGSLDNDSYTGGGSASKYFIMKFNTNGDNEWIKQGDETIEIAYGITTDSLGNIYVIVDSNYNKLKLIKFNTNGEQQWLTELSSGSNNLRPYDVEIDSMNNIYVTGSTSQDLDGNTNSGRKDIFLAKFNSSGTKKWTKQLGTTGDDVSRGISLHDDENIYIVGESKPNNENDTAIDGNAYNGKDASFLIKYNSSGIQKWVKLFGSTGTNNTRKVDTDFEGNVYIIGDTTGDIFQKNHIGSTDIFLIKFNSNGVYQWSILNSSCASGSCIGSGTGEDIPYDLTIDNLKNKVYIIGSVY